MSGKLSTIIVFIVIGALWLSVGIGILMFTGVLTLPSPVKNVPIQGKEILPIPLNSTGVQSTKIVYVLKSRVKSIESTGGNLYTVHLADYPTQDFVFDKDTNTFLVEKNTAKKMSEVVPDDIISVAAIYDPTKRLWVTSQPLPTKNTVTSTPIPNTK